MNVIREYIEDEIGSWSHRPLRYRLSLTINDNNLVFRYLEFRVGFMGYEVVGDVASSNLVSSYLWEPDVSLSWDEMLLKEPDVKREFIRNISEKMRLNETEIQRRKDRNKEYSNLINTIKSNHIKRHTF
jgi:hypothetical protein